MRKNNICKFIPATTANEQEFINFVYEQNPDSMRFKRRLKHNRAVLVSRGEVLFLASNIEFRCSTGEIFFCFEGEEVCCEPSQGASYQYIDFSGTRTESLLHRFSIHKDNRSFRGFEGVIPLWKESLARATEDNLDLVAESMLLYVFSRMNSEAKARTNVINEVLTYSEQFFTNPGLSLSTVANELNYSPKYLSHLFKKVMGMSYTEYLRMLRIKYATSLLDHGIDSIKNVALLSGYSDPLYFSTVFKSTVGMSPKEYLQSKKR